MIDASLAGRIIAVTRPRNRATALVEQLEALGATVLACPAIETAPPTSYAALDAALMRLTEFEWLGLTSVAAVEAIADRMATLGVPLSSVPCVAVVGEATATAARAALGRCDLVPRLQTADGLVAAWPRPFGAQVLFPCADRARDALPMGLRARGARVTQVPAYRTLSPDGALDEVAQHAADGTLDVVLLASPSAVDALLRALERVAAKPPRLVCIGPATAQRCRDARLDVAVVASAPNDAALVQATLACLGVVHA